jgi:hypothetical protein
MLALPLDIALVAGHFPERCRPSRFFWYGVAVYNPARFGRALAARRRALGLNLSALAHECNRSRWIDKPGRVATAAPGIAYETLFRLERSGTCTVSEAAAVAVLHALGLAPPDLFGLAEPAGRDLPRCLVAETRWCLRREDLDLLAGWPVKLVSEAVLEATLKTRTVTDAAKATGVSRRTVYHWKAAKTAKEGA